jgi:hypothetical protein
VNGPCHCFSQDAGSGCSAQKIFLLNVNGVT